MHTPSYFSAHFLSFFSTIIQSLAAALLYVYIHVCAYKKYQSSYMGLWFSRICFVWLYVDTFSFFPLIFLSYFSTIIQSLAAALQVIAERDNRTRYHRKLWEEITRGIDTSNEHSTHGSLIACGEMLLHARDFMSDRNRDACELLLRWKVCLYTRTHNHTVSRTHAHKHTWLADCVRRDAAACAWFHVCDLLLRWKVCVCMHMQHLYAQAHVHVHAHPQAHARRLISSLSLSL